MVIVHAATGRRRGLGLGAAGPFPRRAMLRNRCSVCNDYRLLDVWNGEGEPTSYCQCLDTTSGAIVRWRATGLFAP